MNFMFLGLTLCFVSAQIFGGDRKKPEEIQFPQGNLQCGKLLAEAINAARNEKQITELLKNNRCSRSDADYGAFNLATPGLSHSQRWLAWEIATKRGENLNEQTNRNFWQATTAVSGLAIWVTSWYFSESLTEAKRLFRLKPVKPE